jgi:hypothetical protein
MLFKVLMALRCVRRAEIKAGTKILKLHMFMVEKYLANGDFDKMKARVSCRWKGPRCSNVPRQVIADTMYLQL